MSPLTSDRYYYFATCRHQQTVLVNYCDRAKTAPAEDSQPDEKEALQAQHLPRQQQRSSSSSSPSFHSAVEEQTSTNTTSSPSIGSASITEEPFSETSSYIAPQHRRYSSNSTTAGPVSPDDMAALRPFGTWRAWVGGGGGKQGVDADDNENADCSPVKMPVRHREPGIRMYTDESCDLPKSSDILQHIAESPRDLGIRDAGHSHHRYTSEISIDDGAVYEQQGIRDTFECLEAEVDALKEDLARYKQEHDRVVVEAEGTPEDLRNINMSAHAYADVLSPAERLMKQHERMAGTTVTAARTMHAAAPPTGVDFPVLGLAPPQDVHRPAKHAQSPPRKPSYALAAAGSIKGNPAKLPSKTKVKRADSKFPMPVADVIPRRSLEHDTDDDGSVIVSESNSASPDGKTIRGVPHFAQPTKSFARRASETLRRDSVIAAMRAAGETSPTKSVRSVAPKGDTEKSGAQHQNKRQSLPSGWLESAGREHEQMKVHAHDSMPSSPTVISSPTSDGDWQMIHSITAHHAASAPKADAQHQTPQLRKKTSTYMSPTEATTQRTIATLSREDSKNGLTRISSGVLKIDIEKARQFGSQPGPEPLIISAGSSMASSAVEQLSAGPGFSPPSPTRKHKQATKASPVSRVAYAYRQTSHMVSHGLQHGQVLSAPAAVASPPRGLSGVARLRGNSVLQDTPSGLLIKYAMETSLPSPLTAVPNTTARRRTSHADILKPIFDKLETQGLLRDQPDLTNLSEAVTKAKKVTPAATETAGRTSRDEAREAKGRRPSVALSDVAHFARQGIAGKKVVVPPHLRTSKKSTAEAADVLAAQTPVVSQSFQHAPGITAENNISAFGKNDGQPRSASVPAKHNTPSSSLRATAAAFQPIWKPKNLGQELSLLSWQGSLDTYSAEDWNVLPDTVKQSIQNLRDFKKAGTQAPTHASPHRNGSPSKRSEQRFYGNGNSYLNQPATIVSESIGGDSVFNSSPSTTSASAHGVQAGQVLKQTLSPGKKTMQWTVRHLNGQERPISFGRAPPPPPPPPAPLSEESLAFSPTSDDTSPVKTPQGHQAWTIGASYTSRPYGWKGGDGREISFSGHGPQAEWNPMSPVNMLFFPNEPSPPMRQPYGGRPSENFSPSPKVWPRSQKQWAELAGHGGSSGAKVPCGNMEVVSAVEQLPLGAPESAMGYCNDCVQ